MEAPKSIPKSMLSFVAKRDQRFLSNTAAARQPAIQPKTRSAFAARSRYAVLGSIYYGEKGRILRVPLRPVCHARMCSMYHINAAQRNSTTNFILMVVYSTRKLSISSSLRILSLCQKVACIMQQAALGT